MLPFLIGKPVLFAYLMRVTCLFNSAAAAEQPSWQLQFSRASYDWYVLRWEHPDTKQRLCGAYSRKWRESRNTISAIWLIWCSHSPCFILALKCKVSCAFFHLLARVSDVVISASHMAPYERGHSDEGVTWLDTLTTAPRSPLLHCHDALPLFRAT